jgi:hypothetical protein
MSGPTGGIAKERNTEKNNIKGTPSTAARTIK